jgi:hypothetical protein
MKLCSTMLIPLWIKLVFTAYMAIFIAAYWNHYGPTVFLYFCDVALFLTLIALWTESSVLCSAALVGIFLPQVLWIIDFSFQVAGMPLSPLTAYMFDESRPRLVRLLSTFHIWLPLLLTWVVWRVSFDARGILAWTAITWLMLLACFLLSPPPGHYADPHLLVNINFVFGFSLQEEQQWLNRYAYLAVLMIAWPVTTCLPTHLLFRWLASFQRTPLCADRALPLPSFISGDCQ